MHKTTLTNPVSAVPIHVVRGEEPLLRQQGADHKRVAFYVHHPDGSLPRKAQPARGHIHQNGKPLSAGRVAEDRGIGAVRPQIFRPCSVGTLYMLHDAFSL